MHVFASLVKVVMTLAVVTVIALAACNPADAASRYRKPVKTMARHIHVSCQEDEVVVPAQWVPGTPKKGLNWVCVNAEDYIAGYRP